MPHLKLLLSVIFIEFVFLPFRYHYAYIIPPKINVKKQLNHNGLYENSALAKM